MLSYTLKIMQFWQIEGVWQLCIKQAYWYYFSNSTCSLHVSVSRFGNSHNFSNSPLAKKLWFIFLHSEGCLFTLLIVSFVAQKLLSLIRSHLLIFTLGDGPKKILLRFMSESVLPVFSSKSFMVSGFTFRLLIHFEFIFVYAIREYSNFILIYI